MEAFMIFAGMLYVRATHALHHSQVSALDASRHALDKALDGQNNATRAAFTCGTQMGKTQTSCNNDACLAALL